MASTGGPEELRFDFSAPAPPASRPARSSDAPATPDTPAGRDAVAEVADEPDRGEELGSRDAAAELQRRIDEVLAAARAPEERRTPRRSGAPEGDDGFADQEEPDGDTSDGALTVAEFYERVRHALAREFSDEIWVTGEVRKFRESRGHRYLELADEGAAAQGRAAAQLDVVCWANTWPRIGRALAEAGIELEEGRVVRVRGKVAVWEGGSKLRFTLTALDVEALLGGIAAARRRLLHALEVEGLLETNRRLEVPLVPLRIGVVTSPGSEGHRDFVGQLERSGFAFDVRLERSLVQGAEAPAQIAAALGRLALNAVDLAVVVRGGGARGDLAAFDAEVVARAIATAPFPVWTGIGHTGDRSVADEVANRALITPTACGEAIVAAVGAYWSGVLDRTGVLAGLARARLDAAGHRLAGATAGLVRGTRHQLDRRSDELRVAHLDLARSARGRLGAEHDATIRRASALHGAAARAVVSERQEMARRSQVLRAYDPRRQFERGWALARDAAGELVRSAGALEVGATLVVSFADGDARSRVEAVELHAGRQAGSGAGRDEEGSR